MPSRTRGSSARSAETRSGWLFTTPVIVILGLFLVLPILVALWVSVSDWTGRGSPLSSEVSFVGADNYRQLLTEDTLTRSDFATSLRNNFYYVLMVVPIQTVLALGPRPAAQPAPPQGALVLPDGLLLPVGHELGRDRQRLPLPLRRRWQHQRPARPRRDRRAAVVRRPARGAPHGARRDRHRRRAAGSGPRGADLARLHGPDLVGLARRPLGRDADDHLPRHLGLGGRLHAALPRRAPEHLRRRLRGRRHRRLVELAHDAGDHRAAAASDPLHGADARTHRHVAGLRSGLHHEQGQPGQDDAHPGLPLLRPVDQQRRVGHRHGDVVRALRDHHRLHGRADLRAARPRPHAQGASRHDSAAPCESATNATPGREECHEQADLVHRRRALRAARGAPTRPAPRSSRRSATAPWSSSPCSTSSPSSSRSARASRPTPTRRPTRSTRSPRPSRPLPTSRSSSRTSRCGSATPSSWPSS